MMNPTLYFIGVIFLTLASVYLFFQLNKKAQGTLFAGLSFLLLIGTLRGLLSLFLIETGSYIPEQAVNGYPNGSLFFYLIFSILSFLILFFCTRSTNYLSEEPPDRDLIDFTFFALFLFKLLAAITIHYNHPDLNKFNFYGTTLSPRLFLAADLVFEALLWAQMIRRTSYFWIWATFSLLIAFSKKAYFGALIGPAEMTIFALMLRGKISYKKILMIFTPILVVAIFVKMRTLKGSPSLLLDRFVMDNHMFWGAINLYSSGKVSSDFTAFINDFWHFGLFQANMNYGLGEFMNALNPIITPGFLSSNIRFTNGYPGILIFKTGLLIALGLHCICMFMYFKIWIFFVNNISLLKIVELILYYKLFSYYSDFVTMGEYGYFRGKFFLILTVSIAVFFLIRFVKSKQLTLFGIKYDSPEK